MNEDFCSGLLVGFLAAGIMGVLLQRFWWAYVRMQEAFRPQVIAAATRRTPAQVVASSMQAGCLLVVMIVFAGLILWLVLEGM